MTEDDIRQKLKEAGIPVGEPWELRGERTVKSPIVERQKETLRKLEGMLERQIAADHEKVADLAATLARLKSGGGV